MSEHTEKGVNETNKSEFQSRAMTNAYKMVDSIKEYKKNQNLKTATSQSGFYMPIYSQGDLQLSSDDVVEAAIYAISTECSKLVVRHTKKDMEGNSVELNDDINFVLNNPNSLMTRSDFLQKVVYILLTNANSFIIPFYDGDKLISLIPINPTQVSFLEDRHTGKLYINFSFSDLGMYTLPYESIIHLRYRFSKNDYLGGNETGGTSDPAFSETLQLNSQVLSAVASSLEMSNSLYGIIKYNTILDEDKMKSAIVEMQQQIKNRETAFLPMDLKSEYIPLTLKDSTIPEKVIEFLDSKILRKWGVNTHIINGDFTPEQYEAFYQKAIEPILETMSDAFSKTLLSIHKRRAGESIDFYSKKLQFMSVSQKLELARLLGDKGAILDNEIRSMFGLEPMASLVGRSTYSLNYNDTSNMKQTNKEGGNSE